MARVRSSSHQTCTELRGWEMAEVPAGAAPGPKELSKLSPRWLPAQVPGSVASALRAAGTLEPALGPRLDDADWWFRCKVAWGEAPPASRALRFEGLATLCSAYLDGELLLISDNMFLEHQADLGARPRGESELLLCFRSVAAALKEKRPRPRWKARMFENQNLRFLRTAALGRIPQWAPAAPVIGPWRPVLQLNRWGVRLQDLEVHVTALPAGGGVVEASMRARARGLQKATLRVGDATSPLSLEPSEEGQVLLRGAVTLPNAARWWPHTHGAQPLHPVSIELDDEVLELGRTGFRTIELARDDGGFELRVNGERLFCRGACWLTADLLTLGGDPEPLLRAARDAGMNLIRLTGFGAYESDRFYDLCDQLGLLVWQDFMFGNLDYPGDDAAFAESVRAEATQQLSRRQLAPCVALLCGSSEVPQAAAMNGVNIAPGGEGIFAELLPGLSRTLRPDVPYLECSSSSSPGGTRANHGPAHYFGVGAYLRPVTDIRRNQLRFAAECLAFGHVPEDRTLAAFLPAGAGVVQHPAWKLGMPRDPGAGWDFDDVREHYLRGLFAVDPVRLRWEDPARYLEASRVTTGEMMAQAIAEMRAAGSPCAGALIWTLSDLSPGAGWGLIDAIGRRKAAWYFARRAFTSRLQLTDEGLNGLRLHAINEDAQPLDAHLRIRFLREGEVVVATGERDLSVPPRQTVGVDVDLLLGRFFDSAHAYKFGPAGYDFASAELIDRSTGARIGEAGFFPGKVPLDRGADPALSAQLQLDRPGNALLSLRSARVAHWVSLDAGLWLPDDNYFHLLPGSLHTVRLSGPAGGPPPEVTLLPFNSSTSLRVRAAEGRAIAVL